VVPGGSGGGLPVRPGEPDQWEKPADLKLYLENRRRWLEDHAAEIDAPPTRLQIVAEKFRQTNRERGIFGFTYRQQRVLNQIREEMGIH
jgi:hypothetical protein